MNCVQEAFAAARGTNIAAVQPSIRHSTTIFRNCVSNQNGFTLIEIAIVLVIIGLAVGGVLKGQELLTAARIRCVAAQLDGVKLAYLGFWDRYRAYPGDVPDTVAQAQIPNSGAAGGCTGGGNVFCGNDRIDPAENLVAWAQLSRAGFINGSYNGGAGNTQGTFQNPTIADSPTNPFNGFLVLVHDSDYGDTASTTPATVLNVKTGGRMPVAAIAELDRKIDDGVAGTGKFRTVISYGGQDARCTTGKNGTPTLAYANADIDLCAGVAIQ